MTDRRAGTEGRPSSDAAVPWMSALVGAAVFLMLVSPGIDPDLFWHLETGDLIADRGVVSADPFSWTFPGRDWVMHEWLSELAMSSAERAIGFTGLPLVFAAVMAAAWTALFRTLRGTVLVRAGIVVLAALAAAPITSVRPATFTYALLIGTVILVDMVGSDRADPRWSLLLVPLMLLWVNLHGGFLVGLVYPAAVVAGDVIDKRLDRSRMLSDASRKWLAAGIAGAAVAGLVNPRGFQAYVFAVDSFFNPSFDVIAEWQPTDFSLPQVWPWVALVAVGLVGLVRTRRVSIGASLLFLGALGAAVVSYRHVAVQAIVAVPIIVATIEVSQPLELPKRLLAAAAVAVAAVGVWEASITYRFWETAELRFYPVAAVEFMEAEGIATTRIFNNYGFGGWLIRQDIDTFVDGRADMFPAQFVLDAVAVQRGTADWAELFTHYDVRSVLLRPTDGLAARLAESDDWVLAYQDPVAAVFVPAAGD